MQTFEFTTSSGLDAYLMPAQPIHKNWITGTFFMSYTTKHKRITKALVDCRIKECLGKYPTIVLESELQPTRTSSIAWICGNESNLVYVYVNPLFRQARVAMDLLNLTLQGNPIGIHFSTPNGRRLIEFWKEFHPDTEIKFL